MWLGLSCFKTSLKLKRQIPSCKLPANGKAAGGIQNSLCAIVRHLAWNTNSMVHRVPSLAWCDNSPSAACVVPSSTVKTSWGTSCSVHLISPSPATTLCRVQFLKFGSGLPSTAATLTCIVLVTKSPFRRENTLGRTPQKATQPRKLIQN